MTGFLLICLATAAGARWPSFLWYGSGSSARDIVIFIGGVGCIFTAFAAYVVSLPARLHTRAIKQRKQEEKFSTQELRQLRALSPEKYSQLIRTKDISER